MLGTAGRRDLYSASQQRNGAAGPRFVERIFNQGLGLRSLRPLRLALTEAGHLNVLAAGAVHKLVLGTRQYGVGALAAGDRVAGLAVTATLDGVVSRPAVELVDSASAGKVVVALISAERVRAVLAEKVIVAVTTVERVRADLAAAVPLRLSLPGVPLIVAATASAAKTSWSYFARRMRASKGETRAGPESCGTAHDVMACAISHGAVCEGGHRGSRPSL